MIIYHNNLKDDVCKLIINKFDELNQKQFIQLDVIKKNNKVTF